MIKIVVFIDWLIYYYIDTTQRDGSYQIKKDRLSQLVFNYKQIITWYQAIKLRNIAKFIYITSFENILGFKYVASMD